MFVPILRRFCVAVLWSFAVLLLVSCLETSLIPNCARTVRVRARACRAHFRDLIATKPVTKLHPLRSSGSRPARVRYTGCRAARLARIESFVSHMNVHAHPYVTCPHTAAISAFLPSVVARSRCGAGVRTLASTASKDYVSQIGISRRLASAERQRQVRTRHFAASIFKCSQHTRCDCTVVSSNAIP